MRPIFILLVWSSFLTSQADAFPNENRWPDHGNAKNFNGADWSGSPIVVSEMDVKEMTYSLTMTGENSYKINLKNKLEFSDDLKLPILSSGYSLDTDSKLLHIDQSEKYFNIFSWGRSGYLFHFFRKNGNNNPELVRFGVIYNEEHSLNGFDRSVKKIEFPNPFEMKITKEPSSQYPETELFFEFRTDGVYRNGVFDRAVRNIDSTIAREENLRSDPEYYAKQEKLHERSSIAITKKIGGIRGSDETILVENSRQTNPSINREPTVTPSPIPKNPSSTTEPERTLNFTPWLAGLVALLVMLLGYFGLRYIRRRS